MDNDGVEWKAIKGYEMYTVSSRGEVKGVSGKLLKQGTDNGGYKTVSTFKDGQQKTHRVNRLVAQAFLPNPLGYRVVNHRDKTRNNNDISNLEWTSQGLNCTSTNTLRGDSSRTLPRGVVKRDYADAFSAGYTTVSPTSGRRKQRHKVFKTAEEAGEFYKKMEAQKVLDLEALHRNQAERSRVSAERRSMAAAELESHWLARGIVI
jgi:hypothetical protein